MLVQASRDVAQRAKQIYDIRLRPMLEAEHLHEFVAVEPDSGDYFLGRTLREAIGASRARYPDRLVHTFRVGHATAVHLG